MDDFCQYNLFKKPKAHLMIPPPYVRKSEDDGKCRRKQTPTLRLKSSDPAHLLLLCESLRQGHSRELEILLNKYFLEETTCSTVFLINFFSVRGEAVIRIIGKTLLENQLNLPLNDNFVEDAFSAERGGIHIGFNRMNSDLATELREVASDALGGEIYAFPVFEHADESEDDKGPVFVICIVNCTQQITFVGQLIDETFRFCLPVFLNTLKAEEQLRLKLQTHAILTIVNGLFTRLVDLKDLLHDILEEGRMLVSAEVCRLYMLDKKSVYLEEYNDEVLGGSPITKNKGVAGFVFSTGNILNIKDAYGHKLFHKADDEGRGFITRNILCVPLRDGHNAFGVCYLANKIEAEYFSVFDEDAASMFGLYTGLAIAHANKYKIIDENLDKRILTNNILMEPLLIRPSDIKHMMYAQRPKFDDFGKLQFNGRDVPFHQSTLLVVQMFENLNLLSTLKIEKNILSKFILGVQHNYRALPYHNWMHAFSATCFMYGLITTLEFLSNDILSPLEILALMVSILCHDIDHTGCEKVEKSLAVLYTSNTSVLEEHHLTRTICVLNSEGCNFLEHLDHKTYSRFLDCLKENILATDALTHMKIARKQEIILTKCNKPKSRQYRRLLCALLMTCADLSDQVQIWNVVRMITVQIYAECFQENEAEKVFGTLENVPEEDNFDKCLIPEMQMDFIRRLCLPPFKVVSILFPETRVFVDTLVKHLRYWEESKQYFMYTDGTIAEILMSDMLDFSDIEVPPEEEAETEDSDTGNSMDSKMSVLSDY
ncbi:PREDICTED: cGMP-dependent 3',5'-cyclic phosphodiesterase-like [Nicrophorus vespilloides]|uniref:3',5'-cyclic-GMP phosphodiesterase n=1 Tax=Nicrophorus vespilloides TaxID=110193 RepID=A0ABM1MSY8_NICVS|nr:PREDICTED: cGMP-dependent 3',5'-cyclic phosphodiesterase-like [Nicrophorus vespilloides]